MEIKVINTLDLLKKIHVNIIANARKNKKFKETYFYQVTELLHRKIISLVESIIVLNRNYKYAESRMILRNVFETGIFILYLQQYPNESIRWMNWNNLPMADKDKIPRKYEDFKKFLENNGYTDTVSILTKKNCNLIRNFSPSFIRDMVFGNNPNYDGTDFKEFYDLVCKFSHPSFVSMNQNDSLNLNAKTDIEKSTLFILIESSTIFIDILKDFIEDSYKETFEKAYQELRNGLSNE
jgi:hypothetical protein